MQTNKEPTEERQVSLHSQQIKLESIVVPVSTVIKSESSAEEQEENEPQILPISQELEGQVVSVTGKNDINTYPSKPDRRRLSFHAGEETTESELTPSPSPKIQRKRVEVSNVSSSSEDMNTESPDSFMEDEEFIRQQIMGMGDEEEMSLSEDEKESNLANKDAIKEAELDKAKGDTDKEDLMKTFKKAIPVMRQGTEEEVESITDSPSKGSSSVQVSSFTPESPLTSASSLEEDSDSSPSHKKISGDKHLRKGKHRQPKQPLPTIEDSSEDEKMRKDEKSIKDKDELGEHGQQLSPTEPASSPHDRQITVMEETSNTTGSEFSTMVESELESRQAIQRGSKPSPRVISCTPFDPFQEKNIVTKTLKSAEETYEEIIQKTKAIPGESPPDIEPLYGGMAIEDYLYESLVEEPEIQMRDSKDEELQRDTGTETVKKLRSPEEVYEEMMQKKKELMLIEQEFQEAQIAMESTLGDSITGPSLDAETCVVNIPTGETSIPGETNEPHTDTNISGEVPVTKKKRPAPPRPSEPPKRTEVCVVPNIPGRSIGFIRPMIPQDPALRKALFPIPDLKITQCSSGEEEDDSLADDYGVGISSDITPSDDSETKDPSISPPLSEAAEMESICVVCEIPEPKPIPTPILAPELTTTPSPSSPVSPPTSPATPDSSLDSNATSSASFKVQTPLSPDSTPYPDSSPLSPVTAALLPDGGQVSHPTSNTVVVTIPDVVSNQAKAQTTTIAPVKDFTTETLNLALQDISTSIPFVVQMPDLVSSPSQVPFEGAPVIQASAPSSLPVVTSTQSTALVVTVPITTSTSTSVHDVCDPVTLATCPEPVIIQIPDLVSTTSPLCGETPLTVSGFVSTPGQTQSKVVHTVPVQSALPRMSPVIVPTPVQTSQVPTTTTASTAILKKKVPPPPPPRSTSVSLPEPRIEQPHAKTDQHLTSTLTTRTSMGTRVIDQQMQSVIVDIQPRMEEIGSDNAAVPQIVTPTRKGHVVIIVPSAENTSQLGQIPHNIASTGPTVSSNSLSQMTHVATNLDSNIPKTDTALLPTKPLVSVPLIPPKPMVETKAVDTVAIPAADMPPAPHTTLSKPTLYPKPQLSSAVTFASASVAQVVVSTVSPSQSVRPPPPIPPKPISIPAGLVFSHKPGESVKPPPHVASKAATLPRTKEPPSALSLSLTRPVESKLGVISPKSPLSPRYSKCLQTYVVITLPSELGSPTDGITVQAPVRRGSIPSTNVSEMQTTISEQKTIEVFSAQASVRRASVPNVRLPAPISIPPNVTGEQLTPSEVPVVVPTKEEARRDSVISVVQTPPSVADGNTASAGLETCIKLQNVPTPIKKPYVQQQQQIGQPLPQPKTISEVITKHAVQAVVKAKAQSVVPHPKITTEVTAILPEVSAEAVVPLPQISALPVELQPQTDFVVIPLQPEDNFEVLVPHDNLSVVPSTVLYPQAQTQLETEQDMSIDAIVQEEVTMRTQISDVSPQTSIGRQCLDNTYTIVEVPSAPQTAQPIEVVPSLTEQTSMQRPFPLSDVVTFPTKSELPVNAITIDSIRVPDVSPLLPVTEPLPVVIEIGQMRETVQLIPLTTVCDITSSPPVKETLPILEQKQLHLNDIPHVCREITPPLISHSTPHLDVIPLQSQCETPHTDFIMKGADIRGASLSSVQPQALTGMPFGIITAQETTSRRRSSISSVVQPPHLPNQIFTYPTSYTVPAEVATTEAFASSRRESITMQHPQPLEQVVNMPAEKDVLIEDYAVGVQYKTGSIPSAEHKSQILSYSSEYDHPIEIITTEAYTRRASVPVSQDFAPGVSLAPVTITKIQQESVESQEIRGPEKVVSSMSHMYSSSISTAGQPPENLPSRVTQVVTTEVQRTTVSVVHERLPQVPPPSVAITVQPDVAKVQPLPKQNGKILYPGDVIDLRTIKAGVKVTEQGMDLTPPESCRQSFSSEYTGRPITAVLPEIVNLSAGITPATTLSVVSDNITIVTCTSTIAAYNNIPAEKPLDLQGPVTSLPLSLTTYKPFEPLAQIVYRPVNSQAVVNAVTSTAQDIPINLSYRFSSVGKESISTPAAISNGRPILSVEATGAMDLSNYRPVRAMVALSGASPGVVTTVIEDDGTPVDLTAGRRSVCCDVIYKLPFTGSCRTQPPVTTQPDNHFGSRDDHYKSGMYGIKGMNGVKLSMSDTNLTEAGLFTFDAKNDHDYLSGSSEGAIDLTAAKLSPGECGHFFTCLLVNFHPLWLYYGLAFN